jgi:flagellar basal body-associated protein FliL
MRKDIIVSILVILLLTVQVILYFHSKNKKNQETQSVNTEVQAENN